MSVYTVDQDYVNTLLEVANDLDLAVEGFEGVLLQNLVIFANKKISAGRRTKYIIIKEVALNEWSSGYEMILTDSDKKVEAFVNECEMRELELNQEAEITSDESTVPENELIAEWYTRVHASDELGVDINTDATFMDLFRAMDNYKDVYELIGVGDSVIRERIFYKLSEIMKVDYDYIFKQWLKSVS